LFAIILLVLKFVCMKTLNLNAYGVVEMSQSEMAAVEGGSIWDAICNFCGELYDWITSHCRIQDGFITCSCDI
jgi:hypothetical protein